MADLSSLSLPQGFDWLGATRLIRRLSSRESPADMHAVLLGCSHCATTLARSCISLYSPAPAIENERRSFQSSSPLDLLRKVLTNWLRAMERFRDAGITGDFVHTRLQDAKTQIRLIHLKPSDTKSDNIECTISTHDLSNAPPFAAISYTWGDMVSMREIMMDGKHLSIGENSWLVLWQARLHRIPLPVWIDVLSINQNDDDEKSLQVGIMASIYAAAKFTCVGLGRSEDDSEFLAREIREHTYYIEHRLARPKHPRSKPTACTACGSPRTPRMYRCKQCVDSAAYCVACKRRHRVQASHDVYHELYLDVRNRSKFRGVCVECEDEISTRWWQPKDDPDGSLKRICESCAELFHDTTKEDSYMHMNEWEHMAKQQAFYWDLQSELRTFRRLLNKPPEDHVKITYASRLLSIRPYFTRLWVC
jgi:hypothetical protein